MYSQVSPSFQVAFLHLKYLYSPTLSQDPLDSCLTSSQPE